MKWGAYKDNQDNLVSVTMKDKEDKEDKKYYITRDNNCKPMFIDTETYENILFLVNPDNIENLEWKPLISKFILFRDIPPLAVETCDGYIIARNNEGLGYITAKSKTIEITKLIEQGTKKEPESLEVLTINFEKIKEEYLTNVEFNIKSAQRNQKPAKLKTLTVVNNNCNAMKQQVKIDNGFEETGSFQTGNTLLIGGSLAVKKVVEAGLKVDYSETETETNSNTKKTHDEYTQELDIPPQSSCKLEINSTVFVTTVPFTADLTRVYTNDDVRTASINGTYSYQESSDIKTNFESCTKLTGKCSFV